MFSPALRNRQRVQAKLAADKTKKARKGKARERLAGAMLSSAATEPADAAAPPKNPEQAALLAVLHENLRTLADIQSHELRQPKKAEYAAQFAAWVEGLLEADQPVQDEILLTMMIWAIDYRDFAYALRLSAFVLHHGLVLPERYSRTPACFLAEEIAELALSQHEEVPQDVLLQVEQQVTGADMPDPVAAKLKKAIGRSWMRRAEEFDASAENAVAGGALAYVEQADAAFQRALALYEQVGVKKDIQQAKSLAKKLRTAAEEV